ncbi:hypothetical protein TNCV_1187371 [Trichonephila clavipes]|nr:hypothetical protein TNCV_1187371 [Trichonephila clavipes]
MVTNVTKMVAKVTKLVANLVAPKNANWVLLLRSRQVPTESPMKGTALFSKALNFLEYGNCTNTFERYCKRRKKSDPRKGDWTPNFDSHPYK